MIAGTYTGTLTRYDVRTKQTKDISVWLNNYDGWAARDIPNRFQWTFPILFSKHDPRVLYVAANRIFRSTNDGDSWEAISRDLTLHDPKTLVAAGGPITYDMTGTEWYATMFAFAESPLDADVMWAGSDDGLIHVSRDRGKTWTNVTPPALAKFTRISIIEASHFDLGTAYIAANRYQLDDFKPYLLKTTDYGKTWTTITTGIGEGAYTRAIREDPVRRGLLFAGTETGVYYSANDGALWQPLQLNLPRASVRDLNIHGGDLIAATHGRAMWVLDDISPLRALSPDVRAATAFLFTPDTAIRFAGGHALTTSAGENPPAGVIIDYWLKATLDPKDSLRTRVCRREWEGDSPVLERGGGRFGDVRRFRAHDEPTRRAVRDECPASSRAIRCRTNRGARASCKTTRSLSCRAIRSSPDDGASTASCGTFAIRTRAR